MQNNGSSQVVLVFQLIEIYLGPSYLSKEKLTSHAHSTRYERLFSNSLALHLQKAAVFRIRFTAVEKK